MDSYRVISELSPEAQALTAEFTRQLARTAVSWEEAVGTVMDASPSRELVTEDGEEEIHVSMDVTGIVTTLQALPDGAGTAAFLEAFARREPRLDVPDA